MTKLMNQDRLQQVAQLVVQPSLLPRGLMPTLQWEVDAKTERPVSRWVLSETGLERWIDVRATPICFGRSPYGVTR